MSQGTIRKAEKSSTTTPTKPERSEVENEHQASPSPLPEPSENLPPTLNDEEQKTGGQAVSDNDALSSPEPSPKNLTRKYVRIKIKNILVPDKRRKFNNAKASDLKESISIVGLINPITVRKAPKGYILVTGGRRLEAMIQLGHTEITRVVLDCDELWSELAEIDENLIRNEITDPITLGELANRREEILDDLGLRAKAGDNQHTMGGGADSALPKTTADIAKEAGIGERTMQVNKQLASKLIPEAKEVVRKKGITKALAIELSRLSEEQQRDAVAKDSKKAIIAAICKSEPKDAKPWKVETLLEKVRNTYEAYSDSEDKQKSLMAGLKKFMVEVGYIIEPDSVDTVEESDDEVVPEAEKNTDGSDVVTSSENDPNKANESEG